MLKTMRSLYIALLSCLIAAPVYSDVKSKNVPTVDPVGKTRKSPIKLPPIFVNEGYMTFDYNSTKGASYKRYNGHSNVLGLDVGFIPVAANLFAKLNLITINTGLNASQSINNILTESYVKTRGNVVDLTLLRPISEHWFITADGGYGRTKSDNEATLAPGTPNQVTGYFRSNGDVANMAATLLYKKSIFNLNYQTFGNIAYSRVQVDESTVRYSTSNAVGHNPEFINNAVFSREGMELSYTLNKRIEPFINAGLIQVLKNTYNQNIVPASATGPLPQLVLDNGGYNLGAGANFLGGLLRIGYQYNHRGPFNSHLIAARLLLPIA
jgi:hypothetical protein